MLTEKLKVSARKNVRFPTAMVRVTWGGVSVDPAYPHFEHPINRGSNIQQIIHPYGIQHWWAFCSTRGSGAVSKALVGGAGVPGCHPMPDPNSGSSGVEYLVGLRGKELSGVDGRFDNPQIIEITFPPQVLNTVKLNGYLYDGHGREEYPANFDVFVYDRDGVPFPYPKGAVHVIGNTSVNWSHTFDDVLTDATKIHIRIYRWSIGVGYVKITAAWDDMTQEYGPGEIMSLNVLEETDGGINTLPIGNISSNEIDISLQNITNYYTYGNLDGIGFSLRKNRRIEPFIGFHEVDRYGNPRADSDGNKIVALQPFGLFWSSDWSVDSAGTAATCSARDRLGLMQDIKYHGIGNVDNPDGVPEETYWPPDTDLYTIATDVLLDLRNAEGMSDLEWALDETLRGVLIPLGFFEGQSYFDVVRDVARAGVCFAYMDVPTDAEIEAAAARGNMRCADILRVVSLETLTRQRPEFATAPIDEFLEPRDFINRNVAVHKGHMANVINVPYAEYKVVDGKVVEKEDIVGSGVRTVWHADSIKENGRVVFDYPKSTLIQSKNGGYDVDLPEAIAVTVMRAFYQTPRVVELTTFGDVTRTLGDIIRLPEYIGADYVVMGDYAITRLQTDYDGGLRQTITGRALSASERMAIEESGFASQEIHEGQGGIKILEGRGL